VLAPDGLAKLKLSATQARRYSLLDPIDQGAANELFGRTDPPKKLGTIVLL
jgi:hypothetical protein